MLAELDRADSHPEAIFVLGSADDLDSIAAAFHGAAVPVITAEQADLALARGAALAAARAVNTLDAPPPAYVPPPAPAYVPPPPQPRLRDRIIERIPIINRFHEPQYPYGN
jgi:hypothetical protein